jgi:ribosomal protein S27AE
VISPSKLQFDAPFCPKCNVPMELARIMPSALPKDAGAETQIYECGRCGATTTRTVRLH